jgi:hypothetical protein
MAITNHVLVRVAANRVRKDGKFSNYMIIGDDVVIFNKRVAKSYIQILKQIGVDIDQRDSVSPVDSLPCEIAKRLFRRGKEISPIPLNLFKKAPALANLIMHDRGFTFDLCDSDPLSS